MPILLYREVDGGDSNCWTTDDLDYVAGTETDANGFYLFSDLPAGNYCLEFEPALGFDLSPRDMGTDDSKDNDFEYAGGWGRTDDIITLDPGETDRTIDAGMYEPPS